MTSALLSRVRPFIGRVTNAVVLPCRTRVVRVRCSRSQQRTSSITESHADCPSVHLPVALTIALGALGVNTQRAYADEATATSLSTTSPAITPEDLQILAASSTGTDVTQLGISVMFGAVVALLVIVTGGVAYMSLVQWLDNRQEQDDREGGGKKPAPAAGAASSKNKAAAAAAAEEEVEDDDVVVPLRRANRIKKEKGKGFATSQDLNSRR